ncbi:MAG: hypothetical protein U0T73_10270 [Chitinophagales bacterium]
MSYFLDLIRTFDPAEQLQFKKLDLIGREEMVRDAYLKFFSSGKFVESKIPHQLQLSQKHFDKILSVLLDKTLNSLYGSGPHDMLNALYSKGLSELMLHEMKIMERRLLKTGDNNSYMTFLKISVEALCRMYHPNYNSKLTHQYGKKYLIALGKKRTIDHEVETALSIHQADMYAQCFAGNEHGFQPKALAVLNKWEKYLRPHHSPFAHFYLNYAFASYYKFFGSDVMPFNERLQEALKFLQLCSDEVRSKYTFRVYCELGMGEVQAENYVAARASFDQAFSAIPDLRSLSCYPKSTYMNICVLTNDLKAAEKMFENYLTPYLEHGVNRSVRFDVLVNGIVLRLHQKNWDSAFIFLSLLKEYKKQEVTRVAQMLIRQCENLYFYCSGNYQQSIVIAKRNIKFMLRRENKNEQLHYYKQFFEVLLQCSKAKGVLTPAIIKNCNALQGGMFNIFHQVLRSPNR